MQYNNCPDLRADTLLQCCSLRYGYALLLRKVLPTCVQVMFPGSKVEFHLRRYY